MTGTLTATVSLEINSTVSSVWKALTDPELVKQYFFGTELVCDWKTGSPIFFRGEWEGKKYEDKGTILDIEKEKYIKYNYWSSMSGTPDIPENYSTITYELSSNGNTTVLTILQDGILDEERKKHSEQHWLYIMSAMKKLVE